MTALDDFLARIEGVKDLLDRVAPGWSPERDLSASVKPPVLVLAGELSRSALVLCVSYFEGFLKDLSDEAFDALLNSEITCAEIPAHLKGQAVMVHVRKLRESLDPVAIWESVARLGELGMALSGEGPVTSDLLAPEQMKRELTSIDPKKINLLLKALGDQDLNRGPMSRFGDRLNSLKMIRDAAVHGNEQDLPPLAYGNVLEAMELTIECAEALSARVVFLLEPLCEAVVPG
jgi:hypothetical protein